jgi:hypothetical protein
VSSLRTLAGFDCRVAHLLPDGDQILDSDATLVAGVTSTLQTEADLTCGVESVALIQPRCPLVGPSSAYRVCGVSPAQLAAVPTAHWPKTTAPTTSSECNRETRARLQRIKVLV